MKKIILFIFVITLSLSLHSQDNLNNTYLKFLPSNVNPSEIRPSDIPSEQVLKQMGLSNEEIYEAMNFKYQRGKYGDNVLDTNTNFEHKINKFYNSMEDNQYIQDSLIFPKGKIYGQDIFRTNQINYFQKALDANVPDNYELGPGDELNIAVW